VKPSRTSLAIQIVQLGMMRIRFDMAGIGTNLGCGTPVLVILAGVFSFMVSIVAALVGGMTAFTGLAIAGALGLLFGSASACVFLPVFGEVKAEDLMSATERLKKLRSDYAIEVERIRRHKEDEKRRVEKEKLDAANTQRNNADLQVYDKPRESPAVLQRAVEKSSCWYCSQPLVHSPLQCAFCRVVSRRNVA
jgi:hypothetical protein